MLRGLFALLIAAAPLIAEAELPHDERSLADRIDELIESRCREAGVEPAATCDDATFLRRATLDLAGTIPTAAEARDFLADDAADKRSRLVADLLGRPEHASHFAAVWKADLLDGQAADDPLRGESDRLLTNWLRDRFRENDGYDRLAAGLLTAGLVDAAAGPAHPGMSVYLGSFEKPAERAARTARVFLGVQIDCAECHDHPFDSWKQQDFWGFAAAFAQVRADGSMRNGLTILVDGATEPVTLPEKTEPVPPRLLGRADAFASYDAPGEPWRRQVAAWMTAPENPFFARTAANRLWAALFGYGIVHPIDDFGGHNAPSHPELLDLFAADFATHGHDVRRTLRVLANTRAYGRAAGAESEADPRLFARRVVRPLTPRQLLASLRTAAGLTAFAEQDRDDAVFLARFDAAPSVEYQGGIPQALTMMNGPLVAQLTDPQTGRLVIAADGAPFFTDDERIATVFLSVLSRGPRPGELDRGRAHVANAGNRREALSDLLWALLNGTEFALNH